ncbi:MAG: hypothetical protein LBJ86_00155 [Spirochaetaceae bacterium]|jgi:hypothetical protein|nr:hypothetical protein [Spirochaetaceae bacterium]
MRKIAGGLIFAFILAGCSGLTGADFGAAGNAGGGSDDGGKQGVVKRGDGGALEDINVLYRDGDPYRLTLRVGEEWENVEWYLDNPKKPASTANTLEIDARSLSPKEYGVVFNGSLRDIPYSETVTVSVKGTLTEDVIWTETEKNSSQTEFDLAAWEGVRTSIEKWKLRAAETSRVYFAVRKRPAQTITVEGEHGDKVKMAKIGEAADGLQASTDLDVFTVDTGDAGTVFGGGERRFTLMVSEADKELKMVLVELEVRPYLTGAAIFAVKDGALERITAENVTAYANDLYGEHLASGFPDWGINIDDVTGLAGAFKWLDSYAASGTDKDNLKEYLVRVEKNETLNRTALTGYSGVKENFNFVQVVKNIKIRLRGYGAERRIRYNSSQQMATGNTYYKNEADIKNCSFISIGAFREGSYPAVDYNITLQLEENITIDGEGVIASTNSSDWFNVVYAANSCVFVMKAGSKLTRANGIHPVYIGFGNGSFEMDGGEISECRKKDYVIYIPYIKNGQEESAGKFIFRGGVFFNNDSNKIFDKGTAKWYDDAGFKTGD